MNIYNQEPQCYILKLTSDIVDEFSLGIDAEQVIASFLNVSIVFCKNQLTLIFSLFVFKRLSLILMLKNCNKTRN